jgi:hypothetical protein
MPPLLVNIFALKHGFERVIAVTIENGERDPTSFLLGTMIVVFFN